MKRLLFLCTLLTTIGLGHAQTKAEIERPLAFETPEALGRQVLAAFQQGNYRALKKVSAFTITQPQMKAIGESLIEIAKERIKNQEVKNVDATRAFIDSIRKDLIHPKGLAKEFIQIQKMEPAFQKSFETVRNEAGNLGFKWKESKFLKVDSSKTEILEEVGLRTGPLYLHFQAKNREYRLHLPNCAKPPKLGWLAGPEPLKLQPVK